MIEEIDLTEDSYSSQPSAHGALPAQAQTHDFKKIFPRSPRSQADTDTRTPKKAWGASSTGASFSKAPVASPSHLPIEGNLSFIQTYFLFLESYALVFCFQSRGLSDSDAWHPFFFTFLRHAIDVSL